MHVRKKREGGRGIGTKNVEKDLLLLRHEGGSGRRGGCG
jgi:hypothetical protein